MAKKIDWTDRSLQDRLDIFKYWVKQNKTDTYSIKLEELFKQTSKLLAEFPEIGTKTNYRKFKSEDYKTFQNVLS